MRANISRAEVMAFARALGADPDQTKTIHLRWDAVEVEAYRLNEQGGRYLDEGTGDAATETTTIPIVGPAKGVVRMRHPNLPGQEIDVRPRGVSQRAMAGWEVVTDDPPPEDSPPPESGDEPEAPAEPGASSSPPPRGRRAIKKEEDG